MPELPEVETQRRMLDNALVGRSFEAVRVKRDPIVYEGLSPRGFREALLGARVEGTGRRGKHMWLALDRRPWPLFHLGMTGGFRLCDEDAERPRFEKLRLTTDHGQIMVFTDARRFGRIRLRQDPLTEAPVLYLGFDALLDQPGPDDFEHALVRRRAPVKAVLLDQSFAAGVGNWIADEVLYQARIAPHRPACDLSGHEVRRLRRQLLRVVRHAVDVGARADRFPRGWLFHRRWGKNPEVTTRDGHLIEFDTVAGRTTAWVPGVQN